MRKVQSAPPSLCRSLHGVGAACPPPSQCVFDGRQRLTFVLQVLLQLSEQMVPLLSIHKDLL